MSARQERRVDDPEQPQEFRDAVQQMRDAPLRPEIFAEEMPSPQRIAPYSSALAADLTVDGDDVGGGRLVLLHDPDGNDAWEGTYRLVAYARADVDPELAADPMLAGVGWTWLTDALEAHGARYAVPSGTVTCVSSESFGGLAPEGATAQIEIRASWTPVAADGAAPGTAGAMELGPHVEAWGEVMCTAAGLPPVPEGVVTLPSRRGQRGRG